MEEVEQVLGANLNHPRLTRTQRQLNLPSVGRQRPVMGEVVNVASRCGFTDPSHFARRFRQKYGHAPLQYRRAIL